MTSCLFVMAGCSGAGEEGNDDAPSSSVGLGGEQSEASNYRPLHLDDRGPQVRALYTYLKTFGYFPNPALEEFSGWSPVIEEDPADPELFDDNMEEAVFLYQVANGLTPDGSLNTATLALMAQPRCGFPDYYSSPHTSFGKGDVSDFVTSGARWGKNDLTYSFLNYTGDLPVGNIESDIRGAFNRWASVTTLNFRQVGSNGDLQLGFYYGDHGDGYPFDAVYGVLAHAFYPSNGRVHFDDAESWSQNGSGIDLATVALHELGHSIGLDHSPNGDAVMFASYSRIHRDLHDDDIFGAKAIYGAKPIAWSSAGPMAGRACTQITEGSDPHTWNDNYLCSTIDYGIRWSSAGPIAGMRCTQITEGSEPAEHTWNDNYLCVPNGSPLNFSWSSAGPIAGRTCTQWHESADPDTWMDNHLCY